MTRFWRDAGARYKSNSRVWFNLINEPAYVNSAWFNLQARLAAASGG
ncbi:MAG: hypothetical protein V9G19_10180 [Tetrasphaera sp.]